MLTKTEVFNKLVLPPGIMSRKEFYKWVNDITELYYQKGWANGFEAGKPKERYQGEFGARSNY